MKIKKNVIFAERKNLYLNFIEFKKNFISAQKDVLILYNFIL